ncbi:hypothetical protein GYMLUDRAFT_182575 [Collybiopsis luxurians FD-317 M1]|uniref:F-box domain-containing protein n=1 Tax=Collybiopsis luxurians FD-317 M1 TaxID=944289 RepID=A0A0D0BYU1_9AGAR|nr:hypothetical protein GYMLUDRAFT_182575 [Collybiopsis luxurians FD-317 M1]
MHQALLIDEILAIILDSCAESISLSRIARTCQAWKEPALDRVWFRLDSFKPLLELIPGLLSVNGVYMLESPLNPDFRRLRHYASRVKQIAYRQNLQIHPSFLSLLLQDNSVSLIFQKLSTVQLSLANCHAVCSIISLSTGLQKVDLDLGFTTSAKFKTVNRTALNFISTVDRVSTCFTSLSLRGATSGSVMSAVNGLSRLESLCLCVGASLPAETLAAIATFPRLRELEIQTSHLRPDDLHFSPSNCFPSLEVLDIRGRTGIIEKLLRNMQSDRLVVLRIEVELLSSSDDTWNGLFDAIKNKTHSSLLELAIEHHMDADDLFLNDDTPSSSDTTSTAPIMNYNLPRTNPNALLRFDHLTSLSNHHSIRRLLFETTPPVLLQDQDLEKMVQWWPNLEHLDLGSLLTFDQRWSPKITAAALVTIARGFPVLDSLVIPVNINGLTHETPIKFSQNPNASLHHITLTALTPPDQSVTHLLHRLFPSLLDIQGTPGHEEDWSRVQDGFHLLRARYSNTAIS